MSNGWLSDIVNSDGALIRTILLIFGTAVILVGIAEYSIRRILSMKSEIRVEFTDQGTTLLGIGKDKQKAFFLLPASAVWENTGISAEAGGKVTLVASGRANLAVHRLVDTAKGDILPRSRWTDPKGMELEDDSIKDLLIEPKSKIGSLLAYFHPGGGGNPPSNTNIRPGKIYPVGKKRVIRNPHDIGAEIWLIVNDIYFDPKDLKRMERIYIGENDKSTSEKMKTKKAAFDEIVKEKYWHAWMDDNIGNFFVQIEGALYSN